MACTKFIHTIFWLFMLNQGLAQASSFSNEILELPLKTISGENIQLSQYIGKKPVYLKFWASWCAPCRAQMPHFQRVENEFGNKIKVISINLGVNDDIKHVKDTIKEFQLTMTTTIDETGKLAQAVDLIGTPYHILIDRKGSIVYKGFIEEHDVSAELDKKILALVTNTSSELTTTKNPSDTKNNIKINTNDKKTTALFFISTWCEWYLKDKRPSMSDNCITAQKSVNNLYKRYPDLNWHGIATRLWTGEKELQKYKKKFNVKHPVLIDKTNETFLKFKIMKFPTLILVKDGQELARIDYFNNQAELEKTLDKIVN